MEPEELKRCCICKQMLPFDNFHKNAGQPHGLHGRCKPCRSWHDKQRDPAVRHGHPRSIAQRKRVCRPLPKDEREALNAMREYGCALCDGPAEHRDHILPISRGGSHTLDNLRWLCAKHNTSKGNKLDSEWMPHGQALQG